MKLPDHVDARFCRLEVDIERLEAKRQADNPPTGPVAGPFVILNHDGIVRIERGFVRAEDEMSKPEAEHAGKASLVGDIEGKDSQAPQDENGSAADEDDDRPL